MPQYNILYLPLKLDKMKNTYIGTVSSLILLAGLLLNFQECKAQMPHYNYLESNDKKQFILDGNKLSVTYRKIYLDWDDLTYWEHATMNGQKVVETGSFRFSYPFLYINNTKISTTLKIIDYSSKQVKIKNLGPSGSNHKWSSSDDGISVYKTDQQ